MYRAPRSPWWERALVLALAAGSFLLLIVLIKDVTAFPNGVAK